MPKKLNDYLSDIDILYCVEDRKMSYREIAEQLEEHRGVSFHKSTIGRHYRDFKEQLKNQKEYYQVKKETAELIEQKPVSIIYEEHQPIQEVNQPWYQKLWNWIKEKWGN